MRETSTGAVEISVAAVMPADSRLWTVVAQHDVHRVLRLTADHTVVTAVPRPRDHVFVTPTGPARHDRKALETFVLGAYESAMS